MGAMRMGKNNTKENYGSQFQDALIKTDSFTASMSTTESSSVSSSDVSSFFAGNQVISALVKSVGCLDVNEQEKEKGNNTTLSSGLDLTVLPSRLGENSSPEMKASLALHLACSIGAPLEDIEAILISHPEAVRTAKEYTGNSPIQTLKRTKMRCVCTFCTINHQKVTLLLNRTEKKLSSNRTFDKRFSSSISDEDNFSIESQFCFSDNATQADEDSYHESKVRRYETKCLYDGEKCSMLFSDDPERQMTSLTTLPQLKEDQHFSLTHEALTLKNRLDNDLIKKRVDLWMKHAHIFINLEKETKAILEERQYVLVEYTKTKEEIYGLHRAIREDEKAHSKLRFFTKIMRYAKPKINRCDVEYSIGIANINISDLERYLVELTERIYSMKRKYQNYRTSIFGETEKLMEHVLGKSAVSGCMMRSKQEIA